jgi:hypothetical protein
MMRKLFDLLYKAEISELTALEIAQSVCRDRGLPWMEPVRVRRTLHAYVVWTNAERVGGNVEIRIDAKSGAVRGTWGPLPR